MRASSKCPAKHRFATNAGTRPHLPGPALLLTRAAMRILAGMVLACLCLVGLAFGSPTSVRAGTAVLTWEKAVTQALQAHPTAVAARRAEESAERALARAYAAYAPQLTFSTRPVATGRREAKSVLADYTEGTATLSTSVNTSVGAAASAEMAHRWSYVTQDTNNTSVTLRASTRLDPEGCIYTGSRLAVERARQNRLKASWDRTAQEQAVAMATLTTFWQLELDSKRLGISEENAKDRRDALARTVARQESGLASAADVLGATIELHQAEATLEKARADYQAKLAAFATDLGIELPLEIVPSGGAREQELALEWDSQALEAAALTQSLAVRKRQLDLSYTSMELKQAQAGLWPDVSITGNYTVPDLDKWSDKGARLWSVFLNVELPILDGGRRDLALHDREAELHSAELALQRDSTAATAALRARLVDWDQARRAVSIARMKLERARLEQALREQQHKAGITAASAYAAAQRATRLAEIDLQAAVNEQYLVELGIASVTGEMPAVFGQVLVP